VLVEIYIGNLHLGNYTDCDAIILIFIYNIYTKEASPKERPKERPIARPQLVCIVIDNVWLMIIITSAISFLR
jgi:hypothetical protein